MKGVFYPQERLPGARSHFKHVCICSVCWPSVTCVPASGRGRKRHWFQQESKTVWFPSRAGLSAGKFPGSLNRGYRVRLLRKDKGYTGACIHCGHCSNLPETYWLKANPISHLAVLLMRRPGGRTGFSAPSLVRLTSRW